MALVSKKGKQFLEQWSEGSLDLVGFFSWIFAQVSGFSHVWWLKFHPFNRHGSSRVSFLYPAGYFIETSLNVSDFCMFFSQTGLKLAHRLWWETHTQKYAYWFPCLKTGGNPFDVVYSFRLQSDWIKYARAVILFCALSAPFLFTCPHISSSVVLFTFSTDLELTSVNLQASAFLSHLSLCNLLCKFNCVNWIFLWGGLLLLLGFPNTPHYKILVFNYLC